MCNHNSHISYIAEHEIWYVNRLLRHLQIAQTTNIFKSVIKKYFDGMKI